LETNYVTAAITGQGSTDRIFERAHCHFNVPHAFSCNGAYELPFGPAPRFRMVQTEDTFKILMNEAVPYDEKRTRTGFCAAIMV